ncbi:MAG: NosD domain-containing protein [Candidatus Thorarchaeota archaeon]
MKLVKVVLSREISIIYLVFAGMFFLPVLTNPHSMFVMSDGLGLDTYDSFLLSLENHDFIAINGNDDFLEQAANEGWPGAGTENDPIIISGYRITGSWHMFKVINTDLFFEFSSNYLDGVDGAWCGLYMANTSNGVVSNTVVTRAAIAIHTLWINDCEFIDNTMQNNHNDGIVLEGKCDRNTISANLIEDNLRDGIALDWNSSFNIVTNNVIRNNLGNGITLWEDADQNLIEGNEIVGSSQKGISVKGNNNTITNNSILENRINGIFITGDHNEVSGNCIFDSSSTGIKLYAGADHNIIAFNSILNCTYYAISSPTSCNSNAITRNDIIGNRGECQALDEGYDNRFQHNYWNPWYISNENDDEICDEKYPIDGNANNTDAQPMLQPNTDLPDWFEYAPNNSMPTTQDPSSTNTDDLEDPGMSTIVLLLVLAALCISAIAVIVKLKE